MYKQKQKYKQTNKNCINKNKNINQQIKQYKQKQTNINKQIKYKRCQEEDAEQVHHRKPRGTEGLLETPGEGTFKQILMFKFNVVFFM